MIRMLLLVSLFALSILMGNAKGDPAPAFLPGDLVVAPTGSWPTNGGNLYNQRYSPTLGKESFIDQ